MTQLRTASNQYYLLPFYFKRINNNELIVNEVGDFLVAPNGTVKRIVEKKIQPSEDIYYDLLANFFISITPIPKLIEVYATRLRTKKAFLNDFTSLHIFVLTLRCNQNCIYCQASSRSEHNLNCDMSKEDLQKAVDLMFQSPSLNLTMEFQGGEPSLAFDLLRFGVEYAEKKNQIQKKNLTYVLCTNAIHLSDKLLSFCKQYKILISTSLDGPDYLHNSNRGKCNSYEYVVNGINTARNILGFEKVSALMTTSIKSLDFPNEIIDSYIKNGFHSIFLRGLNPYGLATSTTNWIEYNTKFIDFYKKALDYIININNQGFFFIEEFTTFILRKILTPFPIGFVDLQSPAGIINGVIVYNYDGYVYASDESRMLAEINDTTFRLGHISDTYEDIFYGTKAQNIAKIWATECLAGCYDCAYHFYCGADPVRNYSTQGDMYGHRPTSLFCFKHKAIIDHIFHLLIDRKDEVLPIFKSWINKTCG